MHTEIFIVVLFILSIHCKDLNDEEYWDIMRKPLIEVNMKKWD